MLVREDGANNLQSRDECLEHSPSKPPHAEVRPHRPSRSLQDLLNKLDLLVKSLVVHSRALELRRLGALMCSSGMTCRCSAGPDDGDESAVEDWTEREIEKTAFKDVRLG